MSTSTKKPVDTIRDGSLKAIIWANFGEKGTFYSVQLGRTFTDGQGQIHSSDSFSNGELLRIARLAQVAYDEVLLHREEDKQIAAEANGA
mgnify:CR=1 FL=1